jgi:hypothetical protein
MSYNQSFFELNVTVTFVWGPVCSVILKVGSIDKLHISINYTLSSRWEMRYD